MEQKLRYTLGKAERLKSRKAIEQLFKEGKSISLFPLRVIYKISPASATSKGELLQAGFTASTKYFKKATDRNRIRRLIREAYRLQKNELQQNRAGKIDQLTIFFIYTGKELPEFRLVFDKMKLTLQRLIHLTGESK